jgi:DNA-binding LacI/PurR family transcriptional regulator
VAADDTFAAGAAAAAELLGRAGEFDALMAGNDAMALGALHALRQAGRRVAARPAALD